MNEGMVNMNGKVSRPCIMGILNVTPDSFSDGGKYYDLDTSLRHVEEMIKDGADIIDIGGESTRPGYTEITAEEEIERVMPVIDAVKKNFDIKVSLDTYKRKVAEVGIRTGVDIINDIWGLRYDSLKCRSDINYMATLIADADIPVILMHNRPKRDYKNFMEDVISDIKESIDIAHSAGIKDEHIILDPGVGFAKDYEQNIEVTKNIDAFVELGYPVLFGISRKSVIGEALELPSDDREEGTMAMNCYGYMHGCSIFRVHDVKKNRRALDMMYNIMK